MSHSPQLPVQITFHNLDHSDAVEAKVREKLDKLCQFHPAIMSCRVAVEQLHRHHQQGNHFHVRVDLKLPGHELVAGREPDLNHAYTDVYVALRDAFDALKRQLMDLVRQQQDQVRRRAASA
jgi:ribosomal subunit interface protein